MSVSCFLNWSYQYTLAGIGNVPATMPATEAMFFDSEVGENVSVAAHFARKYPQHRLELARLPCVCVGKRDNPSKTKLPIELCKMVGGEPARDQGPVSSYNCTGRYP